MARRHNRHTAPAVYIDLSSADGDGVFIFDRVLDETISSPRFINSIVEPNVGTVEGNTYSARSELTRQAIAVTDDWNVRASELDDYIFVNGDNSTITSGAGDDTIEVAADVSTVTFHDLSSTDKLDFKRSIADKSLMLKRDPNVYGVTLSANDQLVFVFDDVSYDVLRSYSVETGGRSTVLERLVYIVPDTPKSRVDLTHSGAFGSFVVDGRDVENPDDFYAASFVLDDTAETYTAILDADRQEIIVNDNWSIRATEQDDLIEVTGDGSTIYSGSGADTVTIADNVSTVTFADFGGDDVLLLLRAVNEHSMIADMNSDGVTLRSDLLTLIFDNRGLDEILNYTVVNGVSSVTVEDLIYVRPDTPNSIVDLTTFRSSGSYVVDGTNVGDTDTFYAATFAESTVETDLVVGTVDGSQNYSARSGAGRQELIVGDYWNVTATKFDDTIMVEGDHSTIATGKGYDSIVMGRGASTVTISDLNLTHDALSFVGHVDEKSINCSVNGGDLMLTSEDGLELTFEGKTLVQMLGYTVDNAGVENTIEELLKSKTYTMRPATWSYTYESDRA